MNAAFILLTACMAGADPAPAAAPAPAPAPAPAAVSSGCGGCSSCSSCCDSCCEKPSLLERLKARLHRNDCCDSCGQTSCCQTTCCQPAKVTCCQPTCCQSSCCDECHEGLLSRLKGRFHRNDCCDSCGGCSTGCCGGDAAAPKAEPIGAPKDLKEMPKGPAEPNKTSLEPAPAASPF